MPEHENSPSTQTSVAEPAALLCHCGHPLAGHDVIAGRYCSATASSGLDRRCVCRDLQPEKASILYSAP